VMIHAGVGTPLAGEHAIERAAAHPGARLVPPTAAAGASRASRRARTSWRTSSSTAHGGTPGTSGRCCAPSGRARSCTPSTCPSPARRSRSSPPAGLRCRRDRRMSSCVPWVPAGPPARRPSGPARRAQRTPDFDLVLGAAIVARTPEAGVPGEAILGTPTVAAAAPRHAA
jgi:hypothetical protein